MYRHVLINRYKQQSKNLSNTIRYKIQCSILLYNCTKRQKNLLKVLFVIKLQQMLTKTFITRGSISPVNAFVQTVLMACLVKQRLR